MKWERKLGKIHSKIKSIIGEFTRGEVILYLTSVAVTAASFFVSGSESYLTTLSSLIGVTALIFIAKGNPIGQILTIIFGLLYGYTSLTYAYYGEMITYLGMTVPMAVIGLVSWLRHPYNGNRTEVRVNRIRKKELIFIFALTLVVTFAFYFILKALGTANLLISTLSILTSFLAMCLTYRRSPYYAIAYAGNDIVLIILWVLASISDISYISVVVCFVMFLANDIYGFINWSRMQNRQNISHEKH